MAKWLHDDVLDAALAAVANNGTRLFLCSTAPTNWTEASTTYCLATRALTAGVGNGVYTVGNGPTDGRRLTVAAQSAVPVTTTGTAAHAVIADHVTQTILAVTPIASLAMTAGNDVNVGAITITVRDAT